MAVPKGYHFNRWTDDEDRILRRMWNAGEKIRAICVELPGRKPGAIMHRRKVIGLSIRRFTDDGKRIVANVSLAPQTRDALQSRAYAAGRTVSGYVRLLIQRDLGMTRT